jgi:hypothetical protein
VSYEGHIGYGLSFHPGFDLTEATLRHPGIDGFYVAMWLVQQVARLVPIILVLLLIQGY